MLNIIDVGKMPPQAIEIEESVLGALLLESECIYKISHILKPECFYKDSHQKIYQAIQELVIKNKNVDILTVTDKLKQMKFLDEVGGAYYIAQLTNRVASSYHIEEHSLIIKQKYIAREFIRFSGKLQGMAFDDSIDLEQIQEFAQNGIYSIVSSTITKQAVKASSIIEKRISIFEKLSTKEIEFTGIPSGFTKLDRLTGGWQSPDLIILAARPSMGKTAVSIYCAKFPASIGVPTAYFSLEMSEAQIIDRTISYETKIDSMNLRRGRVDTSDFTKMDNMLTRYGNIPFYIDDTPALSILEFSSKAKLIKCNTV
jgi:replicative DNA helicase